MTKANAYSEARKLRLLQDSIRQSAAFGQILGMGCGLYGWFGYYIGSGHSDGFYLAFCFTGAVLLLAGLAYPLCLARAADLFRRIMGKVGQVIFSFLLAVIYFVLITPVAYLTRNGNRLPAARWDVQPTQGAAWQKKISDCCLQGGGAPEGFLATFSKVLRHLAGHGQWYLIPIVILLLALGILLFFAQTSVIAPFIYTLF